MSFEGYYQLVCNNKHYFTMDVYSFDYGEDKCIYCGSKIVHKNLVDETNGDSDGYDPSVSEGCNTLVSVWKYDLNNLASLLKESKIILQDYLNDHRIDRFQVEELLEKIYKAEEVGEENADI